ncbi:hypothetical protein As57867_004238, partial [Aphanomyces stellatus]
SDVNWSFFGWLALFDWIQGTREVIRFEGDVTTLVLISEASAPVVLATGNDNQSNSTILYYMLLYTTIASAFVGIGGVFYTFVHGCQISGRNLFLFNRVAGSVWIGRPLLLVRALVASIVLGTCQDQLMLLPDGGYSKFTAAPRSIWSSMVVAGEATWVSYVIGDVLLVSMHASSAKVIAPMASTLAWLAIVILDYAFPVTLTAQLNRKCTADNTYQYLHCQSGSIRVGSWPRIAIVFLLQIGSLVVAIFVVCLLQRRLQGGKCQTRPSLVLHGAANAFLYRRLDDNKHNNVWQLDDATLLLCGLISFTWRHHMYTFDIKRWVFLDAKHNIQMHQQSALLFENPHLANATQVVPVDVAVGSTTERHPRRRVVIFGLIYVLLSTVGSVSYIVLSTVNFANDFYWVTFNMTGHHVAIANWFNENVMLSRTLFAFRLDDLRCSSMQLEFSDMTQQVRSSPWLAPRLQFEDLTGVLPAIQGLRQSNPCLGPWIMTQYCWVDFGHKWSMANSQARQTRCASSLTNGAVYLEALLRNLDWNVWTSCWGSSFDIAFGTTLRSTSAGQAWLRMTETNYLTTSIADEVSYWSHANIQHYTVQWQNYKSTGLINTYVIENAFGVEYPMTLSHTNGSFRWAQQTMFHMYWGFGNDLWALSTNTSSNHGQSFIRSSRNYAFANNSIQSVLVRNGTLTFPLGKAFALIERHIGPFGSIDMHNIPCPASLKSFLASGLDSLRQSVAASAAAASVLSNLSTTTTKNVNLSPVPTLLALKPTWNTLGGSILCPENGAMSVTAGLYGLTGRTDSCGKHAMALFVPTIELMLLATVGVGLGRFPNCSVDIAAINAHQTKSGTDIQDLLTQMGTYLHTFIMPTDAGIHLDTTLKDAAQTDMQGLVVSLLQYIQQNTSAPLELMTFPLFDPMDPTYFFWSWLYALEWALGNREVIALQGDIGTVTLITEYDIPVQQPVQPQELPTIFSLYARSAVQYVTGVLLSIVLGVLLYT